MKDARISSSQASCVAYTAAIASALVSQNDATFMGKLLPILLSTALLALLARAVKPLLLSSNAAKTAAAALFCLSAALSVLDALSFASYEAYYTGSGTLFILAAALAVTLYAASCGIECTARLSGITLFASAATGVFFIIGNLGKINAVNLSQNSVPVAECDWGYALSAASAALLYLALSGFVSDPENLKKGYTVFLFRSAVTAVVFFSLSEMILGKSSRGEIYYIYSALSIGSISIFKRFNVIFYSLVFAMQLVKSACFTAVGATLVNGVFMRFNRKVCARVCVALVFVLICALFSSCTSGLPELSERAMVTAIGVDGRKGEIELTVLAYVSTKGQDEKGSVKNELFTGSGKTLSTALKSLKERNQNNFYFADNGVVLLGREASESVLPEVVEYICKNSFLRLDSSILLCDSANEILETKKDERYEAPSLIGDILNNAPSGRDYRVAAYEAYEQIKSGEFSGYLPYLEKKGADGDAALSVDALALFCGGERAGELGGAKRDGVLALHNKLDSITEILNFDGGEITYTVYDLNSQPIAVNNESGYVIEIVQTAMLETSDRELGKSDKKRLKSMIGRRMRDMILSADKELSENVGRDIFGYRYYLNMLDKERFDKLSDAELRGEYDIDVRVDLLEAGIWG